MSLKLDTGPAASAQQEAGQAGGRAKTLVAYIGGSGRSGSTLLDRILGQVDGLCAVGELVHLWTRGVVGNQLCACGAPFRSCPFWEEVGDRAFGGWDSVDPREAISLDRAVNRHRFIPLMHATPPGSTFARKVQTYVHLQEQLYRAIGLTSGCRVVVDSSKEAAYAFLLQRMPNVDLRLIHLVRDSRGVAHSWAKQVIRPEVTGRRAYMPRHRPARAAAEWLLDNALFHSLGAKGVPYLFLRYETLVHRPQHEVERILDFLGLRPNRLPFLGARDVMLTPSHSVSGNPMRFQHGPVRLTFDDEWRQKMTAEDRLLVSVITFPLLARYGYGLSPR